VVMWTGAEILDWYRTQVPGWRTARGGSASSTGGEIRIARDAAGAGRPTSADACLGDAADPQRL